MRKNSLWLAAVALLLGCEASAPAGPPAPPHPGWHLSRNVRLCAELYRLQVPAGASWTLETPEAWANLRGPGVLVRCKGDGFEWRAE